MSALDSLLDSVKHAITNHVQEGGHSNFDTGGLLGKITDIFGNHQRTAGGQRNVAPASQDPYGDPADQPIGRAHATPASQDPYGDPADEGKRR
jgi:hypothetical protein